MPVRCGTGYSRPFRVVWRERNGRLRSRAYHWQGPADEWASFLRRNKYEDVEVLTRVPKGVETKKR